MEAIMLRRTLKASSARPAQTPLVGCADDASRLISNTVALRQGVCQLQTFSGPDSLVRTSRLHTHWRRCDSESELKLKSLKFHAGIYRTQSGIHIWRRIK